MLYPCPVPVPCDRLPTRGCIFFCCPFHLPPMNGFPYLHETTLRGHEESVTAMEFSPDGRFLASGSEDGLLLIFSTLEWKLVRRLVDASPLTSLTWHPLRDRIFCGFKGGDVHTVQFDPLKVAQMMMNQQSWSYIPIHVDHDGGLDGHLRRADPLPNSPPKPEQARHRIRPQGPAG
jgi:WD40 repeat protein